MCACVRVLGLVWLVGLVEIESVVVVVVVVVVVDDDDGDETKGD